jgi:hypothetical protein
LKPRCFPSVLALMFVINVSSIVSGQDVLPRPPQPFKGTVNLRARESKSDFPQPLKAPAGAPNVLLVLLDDVGFGATSTFGGPCNTPTFQMLADNGLKFNHFHTTALCSPTRAALITGAIITLCIPESSRKPRPVSRDTTL